MSNGQLDYGALLSPSDTRVAAAKPSSNRFILNRNLTSGNALGTYLIKLIPDQYEDNGKVVTNVYRKIPNLFTVSVNLGEDRLTAIVPEESEFTQIGKIQLSEEQTKLLKEIRDTLNLLSPFKGFGAKFDEINKHVNYIQFYSLTTLFYGKLLKYTPAAGVESIKPENLNRVYLFRSVKGSQREKTDLLSKLFAAIDSKYQALGDISWLNKWTSREVGKHDKVLSINIERPRTYQIGVTFEEAKEFDLTEQELESCKTPLKYQYVDTSYFDTEHYKKVLLALQPAAEWARKYNEQKRAEAEAKKASEVK